MLVLVSINHARSPNTALKSVSKNAFTRVDATVTAKVAVGFGVEAGVELNLL